MSRHAFLTPGDIPVSTVRRVVEIPDSVECIALFTGAIVLLAEEHNWEQLDGITPAAAAQLFMTMLETFLNGEVCP